MSSGGGGGDTIEARTNRDLEKMIKEVSCVFEGVCHGRVGSGEADC